MHSIIQAGCSVRQAHPHSHYFLINQSSNNFQPICSQICRQFFTSTLLLTTKSLLYPNSFTFSFFSVPTPWFIAPLLTKVALFSSLSIFQCSVFLLHEPICCSFCLFVTQSSLPFGWLYAMKTAKTFIFTF